MQSQSVDWFPKPALNKLTFFVALSKKLSRFKIVERKCKKKTAGVYRVKRESEDISRETGCRQLVAVTWTLTRQTCLWWQTVWTVDCCPLASTDLFLPSILGNLISCHFQKVTSTLRTCNSEKKKKKKSITGRG